MYNSDKQSDSMWQNLLALLCVMWIGGIIGQFIMYVLLISPLHIISATANYRQFLLISQTVIATSLFIGGPLAYWYLVEKKLIRHFLAGEQRYGRFILLTTALILFAMVANTFFVYWNLQLKFPSWLAEFEYWAQAKEEALKKLTILLTTFSSWKDVGVCIIVMGAIPAIGEELVFRGILQPMLAKYTHHVHIAIWASAFIFSVIHLQIYGFIPRFLLGALFGYLYTWTQNLVFPIIAHFLNNSFTLILLFIQQHTSHQFTEEQQLLPIPLLITCTLIGTLLIIRIYKQTKYLHHPSTNQFNNL